MQAVQPPRQFRIVSRMFGYPIFASAIECGVSDREDDANVFVEGEDNGELKARYFSSVNGYPFAVEYLN